MKFKYNFLYLFGLLLILSSCQVGLDELNVDPDNPVEVDLNLMLPSAITQSVFNEGTNPNRVAGIITQQLLGIDAQQLAYNDYLLGEDVMNNHWNTGLYSGVLRSCQVMIDKATLDGERTFYSGVAKVLMAQQYGLAASFFGDIPLTNALQGAENLKPAYDSQESVYASVQSMLDDAISDLGDGAGYFGGDLIFAGDAAKWVAVANGLKARYYMHTQKRDGGAAASALAAVNSAFSAMADQPNLTFATSETQNWSLAKFGIERPSTLAFHPNFADMLSGDPRLDKYAAFDGTFWQYFGEDLVWSESDATVPLISFTELQFLKAEALARGSGSDADIDAAVTAAITANMAMNGITDTAVLNPYLSSVGSVGSLSAEDRIELIVTEAYKAYYGYNFHESWSNFRRTGYPALTPSAGGTGGLNPSGAVPRRYLYPESETQTNSDNVDAARSSQGGALLDVAVWAFQ